MEIEAPEIIISEPKAEVIPVSEPIQNFIAEHPVSLPQKTMPAISKTASVSALSLSSIRAKKELQESNKSIIKEEVHLPVEDFSEIDMLLHWNKYAQKLGDKGFKIMQSLLLINNPTLKGTQITLELPNEGSKIDFETEKHGLLGHLKGHLHNHNITIEVVVNETLKPKQAFSAQEKYVRLCEKNPNLELLKKIFDLEI